MKNEKLRADIKRELNRPTSMKKLAELLNRCYVALGEQQVQEGQYDDELHEAWQSRLIGLIKSYRAADDGSEVRDVFRAITAHIEVQPMSMTMLPAEAQAGLALQRNEIDRLKQQLRAEGDRITELRQDAMDMTSALGDAHSENYRIIEELRGWKLRAFAAEDERDSLLEMNANQAATITSLRGCLEFIYPFVKGKTVSNRRAAQGPIYTINIGAEIEKVLGGDL